MAAVDVLVPSSAPLSFGSNAAYSNDSIMRFMLQQQQQADDGYSSPEEIERVSTPPAAAEDSIDSGHSDDGGETTNSTAEDEASLLERVRKQVEWYFSDENLQKDSFLMKHITRNKQGYVSLKLVASLRKVKTITKDWKLVLTAVQESTVLQVNEEETKIRRKEAAPKVDYSRLPKTLLITNYPHNNPDETDVFNEFGRYGKISGVTFLQPGRAIPLDIKSCRSKFSAIGKEFCILVEYSNTWEAKKAFKELSQNWRQTMIVQLLSNDTSSDGGNKTATETLKITKQQKVATPLETSRPNAKVSPTARKTIRHRTPNGYDSGYNRSPSLSPMPSPAPSRKFFSEPSSPPQRQQLQQSRLSLMKASTIPVTVIRSPHGPDGTVGFH